VNGIAPFPVVVPLVVAAMVLCVHGVVPRSVVRALTFAAVLAEIVLAAALVYQTRSTTIVYWFGGWVPRGGIALGVSFTIDQLGAGAALLAGIVTAAALAATPSTMGEVGGIIDALFLTLLAAMAGFCLTGDLFNMFVFFELMAVSAFALAAYNTRDIGAQRSALNFAITNSIGAFLVLIGIAVLYGRTGALNLAQIGHQLTHTGTPDHAAAVALALLTAGFLIKAAAVPFHFWLVDTATSAPVPLVMILAGVLDLLGVYAIARVYWTVFAGPLANDHRIVEALLISIGAISAISAGLLSLLFRDPRRRMAFVMVAHTGIVLIGVGCLSARGVAAAAIYAAGDGVVKVAIFIGLALLGFAKADGRQSDAGPSNARRRAGLTLLTVGGLATAGLPLFATGLGKASIEDAVAAAGYPWVTIVIVAAAALTGAAVLNIVATTRAGAGHVRPNGRGGSWVPLFSLGALLMVLAVVATGARRWAATAATRFVNTAAYQQRVLNGTRFRVPTTAARIAVSTNGLALDLLAVAAAIALGTETARNSIRRLARSPTLATAWTAARRLHDGSIGDSATWVTIGTATIALVLAKGLH
jgi:multicomponent Na+:H+ antiporter subunit D